MKKVIVPVGLSAIHAELDQINCFYNGIEATVEIAAKKLAAKVLQLFPDDEKVIELLNMKATERGDESKILPDTKATFLEMILMKAVTSSQRSRFSNMILFVNKENIKNAGLDITDAKGSEEALESLCQSICKKTENFITCGVLNWDLPDTEDYVQFWGNVFYDNKTLPVLELQH